MKELRYDLTTYKAEMFKTDVPPTEEDASSLHWYSSATSREIYLGSARGNETPLP